MAQAKLKTEKTNLSVKDFLSTMKEDQKRGDSFAILEMMQKATRDEPKMWGSAIIGFGDITFKYENGRELGWFKIGFSPRKQSLVLYGLLNSDVKREMLEKLGKHSTGKGCLYIKNLKDIDVDVLRRIIVHANQWYEIQTHKGRKTLSHTFAINQ